MMGNKSKRGGNNRNNNFKNRISQFANQKPQMKTTEPPTVYPEWLKSVYRDLQVMLNSARKDYSLNVNDVMALTQLTNLICDYVFYSATHFSEISNSDIDKMKDVNVIKSLVDQFKKQRDEIIAKQEAEKETTEEVEKSPEKEEVQSQETKE